MIYRNIAMPAFFYIEQNTLNDILEIIKSENFFFKNITILTGNFGKMIVEKYKIKKQFYKTIVLNIYNYYLTKLRSVIIHEKSDVIITIGGGYVNDIGKYISMETSIPLITIPTILSNDGIASPISILRIGGNYQCVGTTSPIGIIGDTEIIKNSPKKYFLSGLGDLFSNISAILDWEYAKRKKGEKIDIIARNISYNTAVNIVYNFLNGEYSSLHEEKFIKDLFNSLIMSAISMIIAKSSRPASGAEHNISHAIDKYLPEKSDLHGLQVGYFTLFIIFLHNKFNQIYNLLKIFKIVDFNSFHFSENDFIYIFSYAKMIRKRITILDDYNEKTIKVKYREFIQIYERYIC